MGRNPAYWGWDKAQRDRVADLYAKKKYTISKISKMIGHTPRAVKLFLTDNNLYDPWQDKKTFLHKRQGRAATANFRKFCILLEKAHGLKELTTEEAVHSAIKLVREGITI